MLRTARSVVIDLAELSDAGRDPAKQVNEDSSGYAETPLGHLAVVCDGMGGHSAGREASQAAVSTILAYFGKEPGETPAGAALKKSIEEAAQAVYRIGGHSPPELRPGSTCVAALLHDGFAEVAHVGDSRVYLVRRGEIRRVTRDHSMVQQLIDQGMLTPEQALSHPDANKITRALGIADSVDVELAEPVVLESGDALLLATDGLTDLVMDPEIASIVTQRGPNGTAVVCQELVALANSRGGHDNITVLLLAVVDSGARRSAGGTVVQPGDTVLEPSATVLDAAPDTLIGPSGPTRSGTAPTLFDDTRYDRTTEPGLEPAAIGQRRFTEDHPLPIPSGGWRARPGRTLALAAIACLLVVALSAGLFAYKRSRARQVETENEVLPPPAPTPKQIASHAIEPLVVPTEKPDAAAIEDAGEEDASDADQ